MCIPPNDNKSEIYFSKIKELSDQINLSELSMGMSSDYILAVKAYQEQLVEHIEDEFRFAKITVADTHHNLDHGRIETRICSCIKDFS